MDYGILSFELFIVIWLNYFNILPLLVSINKVWKWAALSFQQRGVFKCCLSQWCPWSKKVENHWSNKHCPIKLNVTLHQKDCNTQCMQKLDCLCQEYGPLTISKPKAFLPGSWGWCSPRYGPCVWKNDNRLQAAEGMCSYCGPPSAFSLLDALWKTRNREKKKVKIDRVRRREDEKLYTWVTKQLYLWRLRVQIWHLTLHCLDSAAMSRSVRSPDVQLTQRLTILLLFIFI